MKLDLLNHNLFIDRNSLKEVTTTDIYSTARASRFSDTGLWSESIFGLVGSKERQRKFGWIDLKSKVIHPIVYNMLVTLHPSIRQYISGSKFFTIKDGLLIEDNSEHLELLSETLKFGGHNPYLAKNTEIAKDIIAKHKIDFIILDISLPGISGFDFVELLKKKGKNIPFIVVTGSLDHQDKQRAKDLNAIDYFIKPIDPEKILNSINV